MKIKILATLFVFLCLMGCVDNKPVTTQNPTFIKNNSKQFLKVNGIF